MNYLATVLADGPLAYYRLGENSGTTAIDSSGNGNTGTLNGGITLGQPGTLLNDTNTAMLFDGSTGYVTLPSALNGDGFTGVTLEGWFKPSTSALGSFTLLFMGDNTDHNVGYQLYWSGTSSLNFNVGNSSTNNGVSYTVSPVAGVWWYIVGTFDGSTIRLYVNNVLQGTASLSGTISASATPILGASTGHSFNFPGTIDEFAIYNYALSPLQVSAHYTAGISGNVASFSIQDAGIYKSQVVRVYDNAGNFIATVADAPYLSGFTEAINAAPTSLKFSLPRTIDAFGGENMPNSDRTVILGNVWKWYLYGPGLPANGLLKYQGVLDTIRPHIDDNGGEQVELTITPYGAILGDHGIVGPITYGTAGSPATYVDTGAIFASWFTTQVDSVTGHPYGYPFTLDPSNPATTGNLTQYAYQNQTFSRTLTLTLLMSPENYFYRMNMDNTVSFNHYNLTTANHTLKLGQHITSMEYALDNVPRKNMVLLQGNGVQATAVGSSVSQIGQRIYIKRDSRITDVNTAQLMANGFLNYYDQTQVRAKLRIPDYRGDGLFGLGYDIETFKVGQTVKIIDAKAPPITTTTNPSVWGQFVWGRDYWNRAPSQPAIWGVFKWGYTNWGYSVGSFFQTIVPIVSISYGFHYVDLELGYRQPSFSRALQALEVRFQDAELIS